MIGLASTPMHTRVLHYKPDQECLVMNWTIECNADFRYVFDVIEHSLLKIVPAGRQRREDWPGLPLCPVKLEAMGNLFLDCGGPALNGIGGAMLDQHGRPFVVDQNRSSSLHLELEMVQERLPLLPDDMAERITDFLDIMAPAFVVISDNDLTGSDVGIRSRKAPMVRAAPVYVADELLTSLLTSLVGTAIDPDVLDFEELAKHIEAENPMTDAHLRNLISGWNVLHEGRPEKVTALANFAFSTIYVNLRALRAANGGTHNDEFDVRNYFFAREMLMAAEEAIAYMHPSWGQERVAKAAAQFGKDVRAGFACWEAQWHIGESDYWAKGTKGETFRMQPQEEERKSRKVTMFMGRSESSRFGQVCRLGNTEPGSWEDVGTGEFYQKGGPCRTADESSNVDPLGTEFTDDAAELIEVTRRVFKASGDRPFPNRERRDPADVVIQWYAPGLLVISSRKGIKLDRLAIALRWADLVKQDVRITDEIRAQIASPGNFVYQNVDGKFIHALYFTNYRECVGNFFRANPFQMRCALTEQEVWEVTKAVLETSYEDDVIAVANRVMGNIESRGLHRGRPVRREDRARDRSNDKAPRGHRASRRQQSN